MVYMLRNLHKDILTFYSKGYVIFYTFLMKIKFKRFQWCENPKKVHKNIVQPISGSTFNNTLAQMDINAPLKSVLTAVFFHKVVPFLGWNRSFIFITLQVFKIFQLLIFLCVFNPLRLCLMLSISPVLADPVVVGSCSSLFWKYLIQPRP